ncbi:MAG: hypothetical protein ICV73_23240 [Acetobacteraceae bacterium]|nr:hypothetical protein [Acetobacteraceae bacterium]
MLQNGGTSAFAQARAGRAAAAVTLAAFVPAGSTARLLSSYGTVGPCPEDHEALIRGCARANRRALGAHEIASVSAPVPGAVVVESRVGPAGHVPAAVSIGWVVRTTGTGKLRLGGLIPTPFDVGQTYHWLLRDGAVRAYLLNGYETWDRGRRYVESLEDAVRNGHVERVA